MSTLLMPFIDESETFTLGFECGQLWERIKEGECFERHPVHTKNVKQIELICRSFGADFGIEYVDDGWSYLTIKTLAT